MRCRQVESTFDVPPAETQTLRWSGDVPLDAEPWNVGLIVGPSGSGKSTVARALFGDIMQRELAWGAGAVLDDFPKTVGLDAITSICNAVGFNTIPAWLRPFKVLSNGEQFRATLARLLIESPALTVVDEFTSVVDRQVARIGSHAVQKHVRKNNTQFVAVSCHDDIVDWLNPDWVLEPATMTFTRRALQRRPPVEVEIHRVSYGCWQLFAPYHYLTAELNPAAQCFALCIGGRPAAFAGVLYRPHATARDIWGISRLVTLPDFQGLGLAFVLADAIGSALAALDKRLHTYPAAPGLIRAFDRSPLWRVQRPAGYTQVSKSNSGFGGRPNAVFCYAGPKMTDRQEALRFLNFPVLNRA